MIQLFNIHHDVIDKVANMQLIEELIKSGYSKRRNSNSDRRIRLKHTLQEGVVVLLGT